MCSLRRKAWGLAALGAALLLLQLGTPWAAAQNGAATQDPDAADAVRLLIAGLRAVEARVHANDRAATEGALEAFENLWVHLSPSVAGLSAERRRGIDDALRELRAAVEHGYTLGRVRGALAVLRAEIELFAARHTGAAQPAAQAAPPTHAASTNGAGAATSSSSPNTADCARQSGQAALPYLQYALALTNGTAPIPGLPPAQATVPLYAYPTAWPGAVAPGLPGHAPAVVGGRGFVNPVLTSPVLFTGFAARGQLNDFRSGALGQLALSDVFSLASQQSNEIGNSISLASLQQSVLGNQLAVSNLRSTWMDNMTALVESVRHITLSLCGVVP
jgi:hypothetical protein